MRIRHAWILSLLLTACLLLAACAIQPPAVVLKGAGGEVVAAGQAEIQAGEQSAATEAGGGPLQKQTGAQAQSGAACRASDVGVSKGAVKIGSTFALSGPVRDISNPIKDGVLAYVAETNAGGGIDFGSCKRKINFVWRDDGWDAQNGKNLIKGLVLDRKVFLLATVPSSNGLTAATPDLEHWGVPVIGSSGLNEDQFFSKVIFPIGASTATSTHVGAKHIKENLGATSAAIIYLDVLAGSYAIQAYDYATKQYGIQMTSAKRVAVSERGYDAIWTSIRQDTETATSGKTDTPDYVTLAIDPSSAIVALQALGRQKVNPRYPRSDGSQDWRPAKGLGGGPPLFFSLVPQQAGRFADRMGAQSSFTPALPQFASRPEVKRYIQTIRKYAGSSIDPLNPYLEGGYLGMALTVEAMKRSGPNPTRKKVLEALESMTNWNNGLSEPITYRPIAVENGHRGNLSVMNFEVRFKADGSFEFVPVTGFMRDPFPTKKYKV